MYEFVETFDKESQEIMTCGFLEKKKKRISEEYKKKWLYSRTPTLKS